MYYKSHHFRLKQLIALIIYSLFLKWLPTSTFPIIGKSIRRLRYLCCKNIFHYCGSNVNIERGASFGSGFRIEIGDNSGLGINCNVPGSIKIGKNVMMGPECYILSINHSFDNIVIPMIEQGNTVQKVTIIEDDVWIGRQVIFTPGRTIKIGTIIGAGCVLTKDFPEYSIVGGNPSKLIRLRK